MLRLCELRDEYFNQLNVHDLSTFHDSLDKDKEYSSNLLIKLLGDYANELYPPTTWIDPAGGFHYESEIGRTNSIDLARQYK
jgi:hypothetical protein